MSGRFGTADLLDCYRRGVFPMADARDDPRLFLVDPDRRGVIPLNGFHVPRSLKKIVRADPFQIRTNSAFTALMDLCAQSAPDRPSTWINAPILNLYSALHREGHAHSLECWLGGELVGGLYGVSLGGAFFGESMVSRRPNASKVALVHLVARLIAGGYRLLDAQFLTRHLSQFGTEDIERGEFHRRLAHALEIEADFGPPDVQRTGAEALQLITQTS